MMTEINNGEKGFALLYAVLLVSIVLAVSLSLLNIAYRQSVLTAIARNSLVAASAAETGLACALYHNSPARSNSELDNEPFGVYYQVDPLLANSNWNFNPGTSPSLDCLDNNGSDDSMIDRINDTTGSSIPPWPGGSRDSYLSQFAIKFSNGSCAMVKVTKYFDGPSLDEADQVDIVVKGYSSGVLGGVNNTECVVTGARVVERILRARLNY